MEINNLEEIVRNVCPDMLSDEYFMKTLVNHYCDNVTIDVKAFSHQQYKSWCNIHDFINTATVGQLIDYLKNNFKEDDKVCYMDCVEGYKNDCTYVTKDMLGKRILRYLNEDDEKFYPYVKMGDVILI